MKKTTTVFLKRIMSLLSSVGKAKLLAIKSKVRAPLMMLSSMKMSREVRCILGGQILREEPPTRDGDVAGRFIIYDEKECQSEKQLGGVEDGCADEADEEELFGGSGSVSIVNHEQTSNSIAEIDEAADMFITRFRNQIRLQKLESFKANHGDCKEKPR